MVPALEMSGMTVTARARLRPPPAAVLAYLGLLLALEFILEAGLASTAAPVRAFIRWMILVLALVPISGFILWRTRRAASALTVGERRDAIRQLAQTLSHEHDVSKVPAVLASQVQELTGAKLVFVAAAGTSGYRVMAVAGDGGQSLVGQQLPITSTSTGLASEAIRKCEPMALADTWKDQSLVSRRELILSDRIRSAAVLPLVRRGEVVGLVGMHASSTDYFTPDHLEQLVLYAEQAVSHFENALLWLNLDKLDAQREQDRAKHEFISTVAHELRSPLGPLLGWVELLLNNEYDRFQARPILEGIQDSAKHMSVLVGDLLDLARGGTGRLALELTNFDLAEMIEKQVNRWREIDQQHHFVTSLSGMLPVRGDQHRIRQVLDNLLSNASKYSPPDSRISIAARSGPNGQALLRVTDQGIGLTAEDRDRLFTTFYRSAAAREMASGTGLGLALARVILEAHGGAIQVESEGPNRGTAVTLSLPSRSVAPQRTAVMDYAALRN